MPAEDIELFSEASSEGRNRLKVKSTLAIATIGWLIIGFSLNTIIFGSIPFKLATPEWQLNLIASLLSSSTSLLIGATLVALALALNPREIILQNWNLTVCRSASWLVIFLVLIIPLQFFIGSRVLKNQSNATFEGISKLKTIAKEISTLKTEDELRAYVASLPNAPRLPAKFDSAFPVIKQRAIENIQAQINATQENVDIQKSQSTQTFLKEATRNTAQAILMATAFSALAGLSSRSSNAVTKFFEIFL
jgi:hypothetical protein